LLFIRPMTAPGSGVANAWFAGRGLAAAHTCNRYKISLHKKRQPSPEAYFQATLSRVTMKVAKPVIAINARPSQEKQSRRSFVLTAFKTSGKTRDRPQSKKLY
ncbi:MAG: hypothetical protein AB8B71_05925, partial [Paracoccaceae bacterium]